MKALTVKAFPALIVTLFIVLGGTVTGYSQPTFAANTPTLPAGQVDALYTSSGVYTNITGINYYENWGGWVYAANYVIPPTVLGYYDVSYGGIGFEGNPQNVTGCTNLHVDVFTPNGNAITIRMVDTSGNQADITYTSASGVISNTGWVGLNFPLSQYLTVNPALNLSAIQQLGIVAGASSGADYYLDNIYFSAATNLVAPPPIPQPTNSAPIPTQPAGNVLAMYNSSGVYTDVPLDDWDASWSSSLESSYNITNGPNAVLKYYPLQYAGVEFYSPDQINTTGYNTMHVDLWTPNANQFGIELVSLDNGGTQSAQVNFLPGGQVTSNHWVSLDIPLNQFTAINSSLDLTDLQQMLWIDNQGGGVVGGIFYIDNVYFYSNAVVPPPLPQPTNAAPVPTQPAGNVLAMYNSSGVYTDVPVQDWLASWSSASETAYTITNTSNVVLDYGGLQYAGAEFGGGDEINVSSYNTMHVDVWTPNANQFGIQLVSLDNGGTQAAQVNITPASGTIVSNRWVSLNIPLSQFTNANSTLDLTALQQLLWLDNQSGGLVGGKFYIDNVYFYSNSVAASPVITTTVSAGAYHFSFATQSGFNYTVQYRTNLTLGAWQTLSTVSGNGSVQTVSDSGKTSCFYRLSIQ